MVTRWEKATSLWHLVGRALELWGLRYVAVTRRALPQLQVDRAPRGS